ncbi:MAG TPA: hypothetical protein VN730_09800 [Steroidobacteraceae bacterium]|nr:hypothetical protein [Steroidobacteraceae bacterium]
MQDEFMLTGLRKPRPELVRQVRVRLAEIEAGEHRTAVRRGVMSPPLRWAACAAAVLVLACAFALPSVRAAAQAFLDLFRVVNFAPVTVQTDRLRQLAERQGIDLPKMIGDRIEVVQAAGQPKSAPTLEAAGTLAGARVAVPTWRPVGLEPQRIEVSGAETLRITGNTASLQRLLDSLGIDDVSAPEWLDGKIVTAHIGPVVRIAYSDGNRHAMLIESRQPQVLLPPGADLGQLADIALRVLGVERDEAYRMAQSVDWRTTLIVPIPSDVSYFRQVDVQGNGGLLIGAARTRGRQPSQVATQLLWSSADRVFALVGNLRPDELFDMAQSVQ